MESTLYQKLRDIADSIGTPFVLRQGETLIDHEITESKVSVWIQTHETTETTREVRFHKRGIKLCVWTALPHGGVKFDSFTAWDDDFQPFTEVRFGRGETHAEYTERRAWEGMQYRVGSRHNPMDSAQRASEGYSPMEDYWTRKG